MDEDKHESPGTGKRRRGRPPKYITEEEKRAAGAKRVRQFRARHENRLEINLRLTDIAPLNLLVDEVNSEAARVGERPVTQAEILRTMINVCYDRDVRAAIKNAVFEQRKAEKQEAG